MSYFNEPLLKQDFYALALNNDIESAKKADNHTKEATAKDNNNFEIAHLFSIDKSNLIEALSQFPATALWLINKYIETDTINELEEDVPLEDARSSTLLAIKKQFHELSQNNLTDSADTFNKNNLAFTLQLFPFSFHDLTELINIFAYSYKYRGIYCH